MRLIVLGGSGTSTPELVEAMSAWPGGVDRRPPIDLVLVGRSAPKLQVVLEAARARLPTSGCPVKVFASTDRVAALSGADVVLNQVRIGGYEARAFDESFPMEVGIPGEETMGPGGFANALRTVPALREAWADIGTHAATALVINLTNPAGVVHASANLQGLKNTVSVCDAPLPMLNSVAKTLGRPLREVIGRYVGLNHVGWYLSEGKGELGALSDLMPNVDPRVPALFGGVPGPYVRYYLHPDRIAAEQSSRRATRGLELMQLQAEILNRYATAPDAPIRVRRAVWYPLIVLPVIDAWINGTSEPLLLGVTNNGLVPEVPDQVTVEVPHEFPSPRSFAPLKPADRPPLVATQLAAHGAYEELAVRACEPDATADDVLRALIANPMVSSLDKALRLADLIGASRFSKPEEAVVNP